MEIIDNRISKIALGVTHTCTRHQAPMQHQELAPGIMDRADQMTGWL